MNLSKSHDFFPPESVNSRIHIIGCGSVGSTIAENLARCGITKMTLYDFDTVEAHNIVNQMFRESDVGTAKVDALAGILHEINPDIDRDLKIERNGWDGKMLSGYIFLAVDNIELRRRIVEQHLDNAYVKAVFDVRTMLTSAQHFAANWADCKQKEILLNSMQFSHEEASEEAPLSACGVTLGVAPTVRVISAIAVCNFINFVRGGELKKFIQFGGGNESFEMMLEAF